MKVNPAQNIEDIFFFFKATTTENFGLRLPKLSRFHFHPFYNCAFIRIKSSYLDRYQQHLHLGIKSLRIKLTYKNLSFYVFLTFVFEHMY